MAIWADGYTNKCVRQTETNKQTDGLDRQIDIYEDRWKDGEVYKWTNGTDGHKENEQMDRQRDR